ncbi:MULTISPECIES: hypothetical protein [Pseudomonas syringae group]|nr:hypothetical protein [Pseudomonas syringae group genomosp. 7]RMR02574.1 hypothetical protein ALP93_200024 [Pseudomonas syringae pv. helianthi]RMW16232.1 Chemotaxis sensory transducer [Pseudomonas syringae pv. tagetis]RMW27569.1 Chemotaxis sensory transducer [Pseudomonas syringae pv. tagetis]UNB61769.1 hypothetical protein MME54_19295 [Pseudomonas syringae pv. helianthi]UNB70014.1 hypothetical protein MME58_07210 [Pseudomonas syringae pv. tagetis]
MLFKMVGAIYTAIFAVLALVIAVITHSGIVQLVAPKARAAQKQVLLGRVTRIGTSILSDLSRLEAQIRAITQAVPLLDTDGIDKVLPGLVDQYGGQKIFSGVMLLMPDKRTLRLSKHSSFFHRASDDQKVVVSTFWNSAAAPKHREQSRHRAGQNAAEVKFA